MKVIGFINANRYYPSALTTVTLDLAGKYLLHYPNGEKVRVAFADTTAEFTAAIVRSGNQFEISDGQYAYAIDERNIRIGSHVEIIKELKGLLTGKELKEKERDLVQKFVNLTHNITVAELPKSSFQKVALSAVKDLYSLVILFTNRVVKHSRCQSAKRLSLQFEKNGAYRTAYRKNISFLNTSLNILIPIKMIEPFQV